MPERSKYQWILDTYPSVISKEQFYKLCHISKRTAQAYLEHGMIPCKNTGKQTRKYSIRIRDVVRFLEARDNAPGSFAIPPGWYKNENYRAVFTLTPELRERLRAALETTLISYPDVLSPEQVKEITGYAASTVTKWCYSGRLYHYRISGKNIIPKLALLDFLVGDDYRSIKVKSKKHMLMLNQETDIAASDT